jgi:PleD family two-component response regulator
MAKILIIDDGISMLDSETTILERQIFRINSIAGLENIYVYIHTIIPDLILLDISFNDDYVGAICKQLKTNTITKKIPIILFSENDNVEKSAHNYLADGFIPTPFKTSNLLEIIDDIKQSLN